MSKLAVLALVGTTACAATRTAQDGGGSKRSGAARDTSAVRAAAAAHYVRSDTAVSSNVTIRADTAWATIAHDRVSLIIARFEWREKRWHFVREVAHGVR